MNQQGIGKTYNPSGNLQEQALKQQEALSKEQKEIDYLYFNVFTSDNGVKLLKHMKSFTTDLPSYTPSDSLLDGIPHALLREGQNILIRAIEQRINRVIKRK